MKKRSHSLSRVSPLLFLIVLGMTGSLWWWKWASSPAKGEGQEIPFTIQRGESVDTVGQNLLDSGLIRSKGAFKIWIVSHNLSRNIQAGEYLLSPTESVGEISQAFTHGTTDLRVTLIEGWRREEMAEALKEKFTTAGASFDKEDFLLATKGKEGYLFPDTYRVSKEMTAQQVAQLLAETFDTKVDTDIRDSIRSQGLSLDQALIIASIIEREAQADKDRPLIAGILIKRWQAGWPLQADATVQFALGYQKTGETWWKRSLTRGDLEINSPYNSYRNIGLPPTPICSPSLASIMAVALQQPSEYWYYLSDEKGEIHYAKTLEEHNANVSRFLGK